LAGANDPVLDAQLKGKIAEKEEARRALQFETAQKEFGAAVDDKSLKSQRDSMTIGEKLVSFATERAALEDHIADLAKDKSQRALDEVKNERDRIAAIDQQTQAMQRQHNDGFRPSVMDISGLHGRQKAEALRAQDEKRRAEREFGRGDIAGGNAHMKRYDQLVKGISGIKESEKLNTMTVEKAQFASVAIDKIATN
jgi:hypothetical protein